MSFDTITNSTTEDVLFAGNFPVVKRSIELVSGSVYKRGSVIGVVTADGTGKLCAGTEATTPATDGSQVAEGILLDYVDATDENKVAIIALTGSFNAGALILADGDAVENHVDALRNKSIFAYTTAAAV